jgi:hypothetical protein
LCANGPASNAIVAVAAGTFVAPFAGDAFAGSSGGRGLNGAVSGDGPVLFHLRAN